MRDASTHKDKEHNIYICMYIYFKESDIVNATRARNMHIHIWICEKDIARIALGGVGAAGAVCTLSSVQYIMRYLSVHISDLCLCKKKYGKKN